MQELRPEQREAIERAVAGGQLIEAIKLYREATGAGLKEAKDFIESLPVRGVRPASSGSSMGRAEPDSDQMRAMDAALVAGRKIEAIKLYREATGLGLKEAKDFVDALSVRLIQQDPQRYAKLAAAKGCLGMIMAVLGVVFGLIGWMIQG